MSTTIPICFFPSRKIILDDDQAFTQSVLLKLHGNNFLSYNSPKQALHYLLEEYKQTLTKADLASSDIATANPCSQHTINIQVEKLKNILDDSPKQDISVLLIDYNMPEMFGMDFLKKIKHLPIKKALITGEQDYKIGVDAFNNGLVDTYIRKDDPDFARKIKETTSELEWKYFSELSSLVTNIPDFNYLRDKHFNTAFKQYIEDNNIKSFCLTDTDGDFLLKDMNGKHTHLIVRNKNQLLELAKIAIDDDGSAETINRLQQGNVIPFFGDKKYWQIPASEWGNFLHPAHTVGHNSDLVWTAVQC